MGKKAMIALLSCVFALCLALVGCGGDNAAANKAAFTGTWDLVEMSQGDEVTGSDELNTLKSLGLEVYVNLNEDGTSALVLFGEVIDGTWEATSSTAGTIKMEGQDVAMSIADSKLTFEQEGAKLTFQKGEAKETPSASASSTERESSSATSEETEQSESSSASAEETEQSESSSASTEETAQSESSSSSSAQ